MTEQNALAAINAAKAALIARNPFLSIILQDLEVEFVGEGGLTRTIATNGSTLYCGVDFTTWGEEQRQAALANIALKISNGVLERRNDRDPQLWNIANDLIINRLLRSQGYELPEGSLSDNTITDDMTSEEVYDRLLKEQEGKFGGAVMEMNEDGTARVIFPKDPPKLSKEDLERIRASVRGAVAGAVEDQKQ